MFTKVIKGMIEDGFPESEKVYAFVDKMAIQQRQTEQMKEMTDDFDDLIAEIEEFNDMCDKKHEST